MAEIVKKVHTRTKNVYIILTGDIFLLVLANIFAYLIRFEGIISGWAVNAFVMTIFPIIILKLISFYYFNLYRGMWRYTGIVDLGNIFFACSVSSGLIILAILFFFRFEGFSRGVFIIDYLLTFIFIGAFRLAIRVFLNRGFDFRGLIFRDYSDMKKIIIIGAGDAGEKLAREITGNKKLKYRLIGFIDDDPRKKGLQIHGIPILGTTENIKKTAFESSVDEAVIAIPSATGADIKRILSLCEDANIKTRTIPGLGELFGDTISVKKIRDISFNDILRREPVNLDVPLIEDFIRGKSVLITGAGGSIGSELCRKVMKFKAGKLIIFERNDTNLHEIKYEIENLFADIPSVSILGSITDEKKVEKVFNDHRVDLVFHAAAYKHVPLMEFEPVEAVRNNVFGTKTVVDISLKHNVEKFVLVSTDKAVRPVNVMGATKRLAELYVQSLSNSKNCDFLTVRFGNVVGSSGSVIPLFLKQIGRGGPVTVTDAEATRFFMTIPEAASLILQAAAMGKGSEIFMLDMGEPVKVLDLAHDLIRLHGKVPNVDIDIRFIGMRPGEKLFEELLVEGEGIIPTEHPKIMVKRSIDVSRAEVIKSIEEMSLLIENGDPDVVIKKLCEVVPDYIRK
ncbi:MAG: polysaccharide biosynthesis protein [Deltaproteobacteria bacterium]|uniref:Polysaccharide biosynthesis protein n=1 Tax=Candidatus Zymogenus saltonus TaxID=2844893 RepID=A0A9D8PRR2_9DELT|nr:polysaccharide biosynthesis protein [Candidatus Zymogenus saltonus]